MRIAIVLNTSWNIYNFRAGLINHLSAQGHQVIAIAPVDGYTDKVRGLGCEFHPVKISGTGLNPLEDIGFLISLIKVFRRSKPDVILSYTIKPNIYGSVASACCSIPIICNVSGLGTVFLWKGALRWIGKRLYSFSFRFSDWIFFQNSDDQEEFLQLIKIRKTKTSVIPGSGIRTASYQPNYDSNQPPVFLFVGRLIIEKGIREFVEAARILGQDGVRARFWIAGSFDENHKRSIESHELEEWVSAGIVEYLGHVDGITDILNQVDSVVLPSYREGMSRTLLEGGAMGKPLITSDVAGCNHIVKDGVNGFLCEPKSGKSLAQKMKLFLALSHEERLEMGRNSRRIIEQEFDESRVIDLYVKKIEELVE